jgi:hypothetical protein
MRNSKGASFAGGGPNLGQLPRHLLAPSNPTGGTWLRMLANGVRLRHPSLERQSALEWQASYLSVHRSEVPMSGSVSKANQHRPIRHLRAGILAISCCASLAAASWARAQVFTVSPDKIESRYTEIKRTHVELSSQPLLQRTKLQLVRVLEAEQGFAMRPLPKGSKGMVLVANGVTNPNGAEYVKTLEHNGVALQAADRAVITDVKFAQDKIIFELNDGPDQKHRILRHISVGANGVMVPLAQDNGQEPLGVRITLQFEKFVPEMTGTQVMELLEPLVDFKLKTPVQAFVDTLPPQLKDAILKHHVLVGMSPEMVKYAMGHPDSKSRERDGDMPFEEWIYGQPPADVEFVRFNGNRVIRIEECKMGEPPIIRDKDEMGDYWNTVPSNPNIREVKLGDPSATATKQESAVTAAPSLRKPGEALPADNGTPQMGKVQFPPGMDGSNKPAPPGSAPASGTGNSTGSGSGTGTTGTGTTGTGTGTTGSGTTPPPSSQYTSSI